MTGGTTDRQSEVATPAIDLRTRYINLLRDSLTMSLWDAADGSQLPLTDIFDGAGSELREVGLDWPVLAHTMIGVKRMQNLQFCVEDVLRRDVPGDLIETGVWRGGACIFMRGILAAYDDRQRRVWVADSFEGLPAANSDMYPVDAAGTDFSQFSELSISQATVEANFRRYGLLDQQVVMLKGFFSESLPTAPIEALAVLRLDGDMYESTIDALNNLYDKVSDGGYIIVDDYSIAGCRQAVSDFRAERAINDEMRVVDWTGVFWQKGSGPATSGADFDAEYAKVVEELQRRTLSPTLDSSMLRRMEREFTNARHAFRAHRLGPHMRERIRAARRKVSGQSLRRRFL